MLEIHFLFLFCRVFCFLLRFRTILLTVSSNGSSSLSALNLKPRSDLCRSIIGFSDCSMKSSISDWWLRVRTRARWLWVLPWGCNDVRSCRNPQYVQRFRKFLERVRNLPTFEFRFLVVIAMEWTRSLYRNTIYVHSNETCLLLRFALAAVNGLFRSQRMVIRVNGSWCGTF